MFTKNYYAMQKLLFTGQTVQTSYSPVAYSTHICDITVTSGAVQYTSIEPHVQSNLGYWLNAGKCGAVPTEKGSAATGINAGVYFGTGPTPATVNDYTLEAPITSGLSIGNTLVVGTYAEDESGNCTFTGTFRLTNTSSDEINIYEVGIIVPVKVGSYYWPTLMERTTFTEPFTILPGQTKVFTYKVRLNFFPVT